MVIRAALYFPNGTELVIEVDLWDWTDQDTTWQQICDLKEEAERYQTMINIEYNEGTSTVEKLIAKYENALKTSEVPWDEPKETKHR
jgi:hypothetical protein